MRFLTVAQVAEELVVSESTIRGLIKKREIRALQIGGRGQWRIARDDLETYIQAGYERAAAQTIDDAKARTDVQAEGDLIE